MPVHPLCHKFVVSLEEGRRRMNLHHLMVTSRSTCVFHFRRWRSPRGQCFAQSCGAVAASANQWAQQIIDKVGGPQTEKALKTGDVERQF